MAKTAKQTTKKAVPHCPFCDTEIYELNLPVCEACHVAIIYCEDCGKPIPKNSKTCPTCGPKKAKAKA
jgi:predicted amidophosphoribosyltransferase